MPRIPRLETHLALRHLTLIDAIARDGTLLGAAQTVGLTQSAVTKALQEAEAVVGARLFDRTNRGVRPTGKSWKTCGPVLAGAWRLGFRYRPRCGCCPRRLAWCARRAPIWRSR
jgi:molybdenum-dependent DNA-binding transcriptional regulator ModE